MQLFCFYTFLKPARDQPLAAPRFPSLLVQQCSRSLEIFQLPTMAEFKRFRRTGSIVLMRGATGRRALVRL